MDRGGEEGDNWCDYRWNVHMLTRKNSCRVRPDKSGDTGDTRFGAFAEGGTEDKLAGAWRLDDGWWCLAFQISIHRQHNVCQAGVGRAACPYCA